MLKPSRTKKLIAVHALCHLALIPAFIYGEAWMFLASFPWWQWIAATAISAGYHRYYSHRSFTTGKWYDWYVNIIGLFANPGPALTWAATHRMHHMASDTEEDPHSPKYKGFWIVYTSYWGQQLKTIKRRCLKNLAGNKILRFFYEHYFTLILVLSTTLLIIDPLLLIFGYCVPVVLAFHGYGLINAWTHRDGKPVNSALANLLTGGEGWHENHHKRSSDWRIGRKWWQIDTGAWFIKFIKKEA